MHHLKTYISLLCTVFIAGLFFLIPSPVRAAVGEVKAIVTDEINNPFADATVEVSCDGSLYATLGTTDDTGTVSGDPTVGTTCHDTSTLIFRVSSSTITTQSYPIVGTTGLAFYTRVDPEDAGTAVSGSTNTYRFGLDTSGTYGVSVWNASGNAATTPFPTGAPDLHFVTSTLAFDWGNNTSPFPGINATDWFVEATKTVTLISGWYEFDGASDDGLLVTLDGTTIIDDYSLHPTPGQPKIKRMLVSAGSHTINIKFYEHDGYATLYFRFYPINAPTAPIIEVGAPIASPANYRLPVTFGIHTDTAGTLTVNGHCTTTDPLTVGTGSSTITLATLPRGTYSDCSVSITDPDTGYSDTASIPSFTIDFPTLVHISDCTTLQSIDGISLGYAGDYILDNDIDCDGVSLSPLSWGHPFQGILDGNGYTIFNFNLSDPFEIYSGMFESVTSGTVQNVTFGPATFTGGYYSGLIAGSAINLTLKNVSSSISINTSPGLSPTGGFVGRLNISDTSSTWENVSFNGTVSGRGVEGGLIGQLIVNSGSTFNLINTHKSGTIGPRSGGLSVSQMGGLIGVVTLYGESQFAIKNSSAAGIITMNTGSYGGGLVGNMNVNSSSGTSTIAITYSSSTGTLTGRQSLGGLVGQLSSSFGNYPINLNVSNNQSALNITAQRDYAGGIIGNLSQSFSSAISSTFLFDSNTTNGNVQGDNSVGGLLGGMNSSGVRIAHTNGTGGLIISNNSASGQVTGNTFSGTASRAGGLIGYLSCRSDNPGQFAACSVRQNSATGNIQGYRYVGGLIGQAEGDIDIQDVYSTGNVTGTTDVGGLLGNINSSYSFTNLSRGYTSSTVSTSGGSPSNIGGLIGSTQISNENTNIDHLFAVARLIDGSGAATNIGALIGSLANHQPFALSYSPVVESNLPCAGNSSNSSFCTLRTDPSYFISASNDPLTNWNTSAVWRVQDATYPTLRFGTITTDSSAPELYRVRARSGNETATITWQTNEIASSKVNYSSDTSYIGSTGVSDNTPRVSEHTVTIASLLPCRTYHFQVTSVDVYGHSSTSTDNVFETTGCSGGSSGGSAGGGGPLLLPITSPASSSTTIVNRTPSTTIVPAPPSTTSGTDNNSTSTPAATASTTTTVCYRYTFTRDLIQGVNSADVKQLQIFLNTHNAIITSSGPGSRGQETTYFGESTKRALQHYQRSQGLIADGAFANRTRTRIQQNQEIIACPRMVRFTRLLKVGMQGTDVRLLQQLLNTNQAPIAQSGPGSRGQETIYFGPSTQKALQRFQAAHNLPGTGQTTPETRDFLNRL